MTKAKAAAAKHHHICIGLEAQVGDTALLDAYVEFPRLWGNPDVLRMMIRASEKLSRGEDEQLEAENAAFERGSEDGWGTCKREELAPLLDKVCAMIVCYTATDKKLKAELPEAIKDLESLSADIKRRLKI